MLVLAEVLGACCSAQPACCFCRETEQFGKQQLQRGLNLFLVQSSAGGPGELLKENNHSQADTSREENL